MRLGVYEFSGKYKEKLKVYHDKKKHEKRLKSKAINFGFQIVRVFTMYEDKPYGVTEIE